MPYTVLYISPSRPTILLVAPPHHQPQITEVCQSQGVVTILTAADVPSAMPYLRQPEKLDMVLCVLGNDATALEILHALYDGDPRRRFNPPCVLLTDQPEPAMLHTALAAGAVAHVPLHSPADVLMQIVTQTMHHSWEHNALRKRLHTLQVAGNTARHAHFEVHDMTEVRELSLFLAMFYPDPEAALLGIHELLVNAVEHGNLGIQYSEKTALISAGAWEVTLNNRLQQPQYQHKKVRVYITRSDSEIDLRIRDDGPGFDWRKFLTLAPERDEQSHGHGIALAKMVSFDNIEYLGAGNLVRAVKILSP